MIKLNDILKTYKSKKDRQKEKEEKLLLSEVNDEKASKVTKTHFGQKPVKLAEYEVPLFKIKNELNPSKNTIKQLSKVLLFIDKIKYNRYTDACTIMPIPTNSAAFIEIWNSSMGVSRALLFMTEIGLLEIESKKTQFGAYYECDNKSYTYRYYYENELKIIDYCKKLNIKKYKYDDLKKKSIPEELLKQIRFDKSEVRFSSNLNLVKPNKMTRPQFKQFLMDCLYENYPDLKRTRELCEGINSKYYANDPQFAIRFNPHFTWSKDRTAINRISIRATNQWCNMKEEDRKKKLEELGFNLNKDIDASIARVHLSINKLNWYCTREDIYKMMHDFIEPNCEFDRKKFKQLFYQIYFDSGSEEEMNSHIYNKISNPRFRKKEIYEYLNKMREAIFKFLGSQSYGVEIFYAESCIYIETLVDLLSSGHKVWLVYDCFYASGDETQEEFDALIEERLRWNFFFFLPGFKKELIA